jgi:hypothetical protein
MTRQEYISRRDRAWNEALQIFIRNCPVDKGALRDSIKLVRTSEGASIVIGQGLDYADDVNAMGPHKGWIEKSWTEASYLIGGFFNSTPR